jgi:hypothetical protein
VQGVYTLSGSFVAMIFVPCSKGRRFKFDRDALAAPTSSRSTHSQTDPRCLSPGTNDLRCPAPGKCVWRLYPTTVLRSRADKRNLANNPNTTSERIISSPPKLGSLDWVQLLWQGSTPGVLSAELRLDRESTYKPATRSCRLVVLRGCVFSSSWLARRTSPCRIFRGCRFAALAGPSLSR